MGNYSVDLRQSNLMCVMSSELLNLTWKNFQQCASDSFKELISQTAFVDVTLVFLTLGDFV